MVLTKDDRIRYRQHELEALMDAGVRSFVLTSRNLTGEEMAATFVKFLPRMLRIAGGTRRAFIARVTQTRVAKIVEERKRRR